MKARTTKPLDPDTYRLPCDVWLGPRTRLVAGTTLANLLEAMTKRRQVEPPSPDSMTQALKDRPE